MPTHMGYVRKKKKRSLEPIYPGPGCERGRDDYTLVVCRPKCE
jgi:hypothetical protein